MFVPDLAKKCSEPLKVKTVSLPFTAFCAKPKEKTKHGLEATFSQICVILENKPNNLKSVGHKKAFGFIKYMLVNLTNIFYNICEASLYTKPTVS